MHAPDMIAAAVLALRAAPPPSPVDLLFTGGRVVYGPGRARN